MRNIILKFPEGTYDNSDAARRVIGYIASKNILPVAGFGFWPPLPDTAIYQFEETSDFNPCVPERYIWHFIVSFDSGFGLQYVRLAAVSICQLFCAHYQILYGIHARKEKGYNPSYHIHFAVNSIGYNRPYPELTANVMTNYISQITDMLMRTSGLPVTLEGVNLC